MNETLVMKNIANVPEEDSQSGKGLLERFLQIPYIKNNASITREANHLLNRLKDKSFKIAVVGEFSSGKSTFLNAIVGKDYLTHGVKETTAAVTMLVNMDTAKNGFGRIIFSDGAVTPLESYSQLKEVTTTQSTMYQVSNQIDFVELFVPFMDTEVPIVLVDTPGLNGVAAMHRERTIDIIQGVHACIYMLQARGISETDKNTLQWISQYQQELIVVQNFIDNINKSEGDTLEYILNKQRKILAENVFPNQEQINYTVCGISAMKALTAKDTSIERLYSTDTVYLTASKRHMLYKESNFEQALNSINQFMECAFQRSHLSTLHAIDNLFERTANILNNQFEILNARWIESDDAQIIQHTRQLLDNWETRQAENETKLGNFISSKMNECKNLTVKELILLIEEAKKRVPDMFVNINTPDEWDAFTKSEIIEAEIADYSNKIRRSMGEYLTKFSGNIYNLAIVRIQEYSGLTDALEEVYLPEFTIKIGDPKLNQFAQEKSMIEKEKATLQKLQNQKKEEEYKKAQLLGKKNSNKAILNQQHQKQSILQSDYDRQKRHLGQMPEAIPYYEDIEVDKERSGWFGSIKDFMFGHQKTTIKEIRYNYSDQEKWAEENRQIENNYKRQKRALKKQLEDLEEEIESIQEEIAELENRVLDDARRINKKKELVREMIESWQEKGKLAAKEYVERQKTKLKTHARIYFSETLQDTLTESIGNEIITIKNNLCQKVREVYVNIARNQKEKLQQMLNKNCSNDSIQHENLKRDMDDVLEIKKNLEVYLCK